MPNERPPAAIEPAAPRSSRAEYARRMNRVLDYIDQHLDTPLDLAVLADVANFSRFHFHRVFSEWLGETLGDYARRRRLEVGAMLLACQPGKPVLDVALSTGFGSGEAFARAFKTKFGCTPTAWRIDAPQRRAAELVQLRARRLRRDSNPDQAHSKDDQAANGPLRHHEGSHPPPGVITMNVTIIDLPATRVAYQRTIGPYGPRIGQFWRDSFAPWLRANGLAGAATFGVGHDDPCVTPPEKCRYDACVAVPDNFQPSGQTGVQTLPGGRYAVAHFKGQTSDIAEAWSSMFREWLPASGMQGDARPCFERYAPGTFDAPPGPVFECELCIPVKPL